MRDILKMKGVMPWQSLPELVLSLPEYSFLPILVLPLVRKKVGCCSIERL